MRLFKAAKPDCFDDPGGTRSNSILELNRIDPQIARIESEISSRPSVAETEMLTALTGRS